MLDDTRRRNYNRPTMEEKEHRRWGDRGINSSNHRRTLDKYNRISTGEVIGEGEEDYTRPTRLVTIALYVQHDIVRWIYLEVFVFLIAPTRRDTRD